MQDKDKNNDNPDSTTSTPDTKPVTVGTDSTTTSSVALPTTATMVELATASATAVSTTPLVPGSESASMLETANSGATATNMPAAVPVVAVSEADPATLVGGGVFKQYAIALVVVVLMGGGLWYVMEAQGRIQTGVFANIKAVFVPEPAAATVNGERLTVAQVERNKVQLKAAAQAQGADPSAPEIVAEIDKQALDLLINTEVLRQAAVAAGGSVAEADTEARYQEIVSQLGGEEALGAKMVELGLTTEGLRKDIAGEILIQEYLKTAIDSSALTVTEAEVLEFYNQVKASNPDVPVLDDEIKATIEKQLATQKEQELISDHLDSLRAQANIEIIEVKS